MSALKNSNRNGARTNLGYHAKPSSQKRIFNGTVLTTGDGAGTSDTGGPEANDECTPVIVEETHMEQVPQTRGQSAYGNYYNTVVPAKERSL